MTYVAVVRRKSDQGNQFVPVRFGFRTVEVAEGGVLQAQRRADQASRRQPARVVQHPRPQRDEAGHARRRPAHEAAQHQLRPHQPLSAAPVLPGSVRPVRPARHARVRPRIARHETRRRRFVRPVESSGLERCTRRPHRADRRPRPEPRCRSSPGRSATRAATATTSTAMAKTGQGDRPDAAGALRRRRPRRRHGLRQPHVLDARPGRDGRHRVERPADVPGGGSGRPT